MANIFGRLNGPDIKWNLTLPANFLPQNLGAWMAPPITIHRMPPSPNYEVEFTTQTDFPDRVQEFLDEIGNNYHVPAHSDPEEKQEGASPASGSSQATQDQPNRGRASSATPQPENDPHATSNNHAVGLPSNGQPAGSESGDNIEHNRGATPPLGDLHINIPHRISEGAKTLPNSSKNTIDPLVRHHTLNSMPRESGAPHAPKSRPKTRCQFGPNRRATLRDCQIKDYLASPLEEKEALELRTEEESGIEELLREIDFVRGQSPLPSSLHDNEDGQYAQDVRPDMSYTWENENARTTGRVPKSRPKVKCRFGPYKRGSASLTRQDTEPLLGAERSQAMTPTPCLLTASGRSPVPQPIKTPCTSLGVGPFRTTLTNPTTRRSFPFARYYPTAPEAPRPNPNRFALAHLGISEETLDAKATREVDEILCYMKAERQLARITPGPSVDIPQPLSKEDCLTLFRATGVPPLGSLWGVYKWATDLGMARFNFDVEVEGDDYSFLNAYD